MPIRLQAEATGKGVILSRFPSPDDAETVRNFLFERAIPATTVKNEILLVGMTMERLASLANEANIELI